jgi:ComF family protein
MAKSIIAKTASTYLSAFMAMVFPNLCVVCSRNLLRHERAICKPCEERLPTTGFHQQKSNIVERIFWGRVAIANATAYLFYRKDEQAQKILHAIKYKGNLALGNKMGKLMGQSLLLTDWHGEIDVIVPVPLHPKKQKLRGYNQSEVIANGIAERLNVSVSTDYLIRQRFTDTQTRKGRYDRYKNMADVFETINHDRLAGKHVLLVDDVVTTGGTLEACASKLLEVPGVKVSIATLAYAVN